MPPAINRTMTPSEWSLLVFLAVLWGGSYFYVGVAIKVLSPLDIVAFRVGLGAVLLYLVVRLTGARMPRDRATWGAFFVMAITNNVIPFNLIAWAQSHVASGLAAILNATTPLFAVVLAHYLSKDERMTPLRIAGVVIGFGKVLWVIVLIVLPYIGIFAYILTQGGGMAERNRLQARQARDELRQAVGFSAADDLVKLDRLVSENSISKEEYARLRARLLQ